MPKSTELGFPHHDVGDQIYDLGDHGIHNFGCTNRRFGCPNLPPEALWRGPWSTVVRGPGELTRPTHSLRVRYLGQCLQKVRVKKQKLYTDFQLP